ncbi:hydrogenase expression protein [Vibrio coralliilyticus]
MKKTTISLLVTAALMGSPLLAVQSAIAAPQNSIAATQSESVETQITMQGVEEWYSTAQVTVSNVSGETLDLDSAEVWVTTSKDASVNTVWGAPGFSVSSPAPNTFVFTHDATSDPLSAGASFDLIFGLNSTNGDFIDQNDLSVEQVIIKNDPALQGKIELIAPTSPHSSLSSASILVEGESYTETVSVAWGSTYTLDHLKDGEYQVTALDVSSEEGIATAASPTTTVTVDSDQAAPTASVQYDAFVYYAAIDLTMPAIEGVAGSLTTNVAVHPAGSEDIERSVIVPFGGNLDIGKLLDGHSYDLSYSPVTVNNTLYQPQDNLNISVNKDSETEVTADVSSTAIDTEGFRIVETTLSGLPSEAMPVLVNLVATDGSGLYSYEITENTFTLPDTVKPGEYQVEIDPVSAGETRYAYDGEESVTVTEGSTPFVLALPFREAMSLAVKGFPDFVANGTVTNDSEQATQEIGATRVDAIFKYAGLSGSGDPDVILPKDGLPLHTTYANAQTASGISGKPVLPVMVVYTANASGGASWGDLKDNNLLYKHYATFITQATAAQEYARGDGSSPMSFVLNPDFLGELQKNPSDVEMLSVSGSVEVNNQLARALEYMEETYGYQPPVEIPQFEDTLKGYIASLNFIMNAFAEDVTYGWQINLWAVGSANWIHTSEDQSEAKGQEVAEFIASLDVYSGTYTPDYIVFDKYERDGFGSEAIANYAYNATSWTRYLSYVKTISDGADSPAMIWQIPGGHMPTKEEGNDLISVEHEASGGSYFMGDARISTDISTIRAGLLDKALSAEIYNGASNVGELLAKDNGYDWSRMAMHDLPKSNVFSIFWGGGSTTAVVSIGSNGTDNGWLDGKVDAYAQSPACLMGNECDGSIWGGEGGETPPPGNQPPVIDLSPNYEVDSGETVTITASATDPEGEQVSYQWTVPSDLTVVGDANSATLEVTAPVTDYNLTYSISLEASDGEESAVKSTQLKVIGENTGGGDGICADIPEFEPGQYEEGAQVTYQGSLYEAERWTDAELTPADPYSGWVWIGSCTE